MHPTQAIRSLLLVAFLYAALSVSLTSCGDAAQDTVDGVDGTNDGNTSEVFADAPDARTDDAGRPEVETVNGRPTFEQALELRPLSSADRRIVDDRGRDVLLRGVNVTSIGEYWQGDPAQPPTLPTTDEDWDEMAARGLSVIRLIVHWSRIEPFRGQIDQGYLDTIEEMVQAAAARGIYTVIDMHQDAYSAFIFTPPGTDCPEGTHPAKGWDGAPAWAVITDGLSTCTPGERNASPAVRAAWTHFYHNTDGIRDRFVASWAAVAERFAGRPEVAGYDLLNEPEVPQPASELTPYFDALVRDTVEAIRGAEASAAFEHLIFVEMGLPAGDKSFGLVLPDPERMGVESRNLVSASHNYAETINNTGLSFEAMNQVLLNFARRYDMATWIGEYGFWDTSESTLEKLSRYAADEDRQLLGGAWWQWRQPCGDPHSYGPTGEHVVTHLHRLGCPGDEDLGPTEEFLSVLGRGYPRAAPGRLTLLESDPLTGTLGVEGEATRSGDHLVVWSPTSTTSHEDETTGLGDLLSWSVPGGRILAARVEAPGPYALHITPR